MAHHKRGLTRWRRGRGRSGLVSFKAWHVTNEDSLAGGEEEGGRGYGASKVATSQPRPPSPEEKKREEKVGELRSTPHHKRGLTIWRRGRGTSSLVSSETTHVRNEDSFF